MVKMVGGARCGNSQRSQTPNWTKGRGEKGKKGRREERRGGEKRGGKYVERGKKCDIAVVLN